ncbi:NADH-quinone oxidoreductase subunit C [Roseivirga sp. UBA838]|uniref:NADH-quinone oxidoreductase subunit C n=1 Tax=Roseivirga sp. UBA838 TaxID=1947393 RepID=UPI00257AD480|nr:NADH-quinone oxidoreductase subunit C [Roseivirga sp. UBA838]|tara:strand:- start:20283 stop:20765 length:483 start_codon:yes stop_codon:yes gene_type:complete
MKAEEIKILLEKSFPGKAFELIENATPQGLAVSAEDLVEVMDFLHTHNQLYFDMLSCITGLDNGPETGTMEVIYNLYSIPNNIHLMVKVVLNRYKPTIDSLVDLWKTADWQEREVFDMFGIHFNNHPDLRRILMPADWEGYPLRKDYKEQTYYRGMKVEY